MKLSGIILICLVIAFPFNVKALEISASRAVLYEPVTDRVLYEKNMDEQCGMASTTKIITAITAIEHGNLSDVVMVSKKAADVEGSSVWLEEGEKQTLENLLYGLMLSSGNDAAIAIAEHISESTEKFALLMNETAKKAGAKNSSFRNPNGLDEEGHFTTAYDLAKITAYAMKNEKFKEIVSTKTKTIPWEGHQWDRTLKNHNKLLNLYEGADGVKTGFTKKCGRCLVSSALRNGVRLIAVTLNAPDDWNDHMKMLDYGFSITANKTVVKKNEVIKKAFVKNGTKNSVGLVAIEGISLPMLESDNEEIKFNLVSEIAAPIQKGKVLGNAEVLVNGKKITETELIASENIDELYIPTLWDNFKLILNKIFN